MVSPASNHTVRPVWTKMSREGVLDRYRGGSSRSEGHVTALALVRDCVPASSEVYVGELEKVLAGRRPEAQAVEVAHLIEVSPRRRPGTRDVKAERPPPRGPTAPRLCPLRADRHPRQPHRPHRHEDPSATPSHTSTSRLSSLGAGTTAAFRSLTSSPHDRLRTLWRPAEDLGDPDFADTLDQFTAAVRTREIYRRPRLEVRGTSSLLVALHRLERFPQDAEIVVDTDERSRLSVETQQLVDRRLARTYGILHCVDSISRHLDELTCEA